MLKKLSIELDEALHIFHKDGNVGIKIELINTLLDSGYIKHKFGGGWMLSSKGNRYIKEQAIANKKSTSES